MVRQLKEIKHELAELKQEKTISEIRPRNIQKASKIQGVIYRTVLRKQRTCKMYIREQNN